MFSFTKSHDSDENQIVFNHKCRNDLINKIFGSHLTYIPYIFVLNSVVHNFTCSTTKFVVLNFVLSRERRTVLADELVRRECVAGVAMTTTRADKFPNSCKARRVAWHLFYVPKLLGRVSAALVFKERLPLFPYSYYILDSWLWRWLVRKHTKK